MTFPGRTSRLPVLLTPRPILEVAHDLGINDTELELYGPTKAKVTLVPLAARKRAAPREVRPGDRDLTDAPRRGQVDDDGRPRAGS